VQFRKYMHIERLGSDVVQDILKGTCYIFPKLDGANASIWLGDDGKVKCGSRNKELSQIDDLRGFWQWVQCNEELTEYFDKRPSDVIHGEWLVSHNIKYRSTCYNKFYIFDIWSDNHYMNYGEVQAVLAIYHDLRESLIPVLSILVDATSALVEACVPNANYYLLPENAQGEGIVIKNYNYRDKFGHVTWAKVVQDEFKFEQKKPKLIPNIGDIEKAIIDKTITTALLIKEYSKFYPPESDTLLQGQTVYRYEKIPRMLQAIYYCLITEELWDCLKKFKNPTINFKVLKKLCDTRVREFLLNNTDAC